MRNSIAYIVYMSILRIYAGSFPRAEEAKPSLFPKHCVRNHNTPARPVRHTELLNANERCIQRPLSRHLPTPPPNVCDYPLSNRPADPETRFSRLGSEPSSFTGLVSPAALAQLQAPLLGSSAAAARAADADAPPSPTSDYVDV